MQRERSNGKAIGERQMSGLRNLTTRMALGTKALVAVVLMGGVLTIATAATVTPAAAFSSTPSWFTTGGTAAPTLTCGTWYVHDHGGPDRRR